ncbi:hypothetical protein IMSAGC015_02338 [Lachnospiraceae bacterium]|nr:hypothetical protein IMSAGC015_02338 [Lachnospiraceae bacterium]
MCDTDRIGKLDLTFSCQPCRHNILSYIACRISRRTIHLGTVLSGKCAAAVACHPAVCIYNNLTPCKAAVPIRPADHEPPCRVDEEFCILIYHTFRNDGVKYMFLDILMDLLLRHVRIMLCRKHYRIQPLRYTLFVILYRNLGLSVRSQIRKRAVLPHLCEPDRKLVCQ